MRKKSIADRAKVFEFIQESPWSAAREISAGVGLSESVVRRHIRALLEGGHIREKRVVLRRLVSAMGYAAKHAQDVGEWTITLDNRHTCHPISVKMGLTLDGSDADPDLLGRNVEYGREHADMPITDWRLTIWSRQAIELLHDEEEHTISYFDPQIRAWIRGQVFLQKADIAEAVLKRGEERVLYTYRLNGLGNPNAPEIEWMPE